MCVGTWPSVSVCIGIWLFVSVGVLIIDSLWVCVLVLGCLWVWVCWYLAHCECVCVSTSCLRVCVLALDSLWFCVFVLALGCLWVCVCVCVLCVGIWLSVSECVFTRLSVSVYVCWHLAVCEWVCVCVGTWSSCVCACLGACVYDTFVTVNGMPSIPRSTFLIICEISTLILNADPQIRLIFCAIARHLK